MGLAVGGMIPPIQDFRRAVQGIRLSEQGDRMRRCVILLLVLFVVVSPFLSAGEGMPGGSTVSFVDVYSRLLKDPVYQDLRERLERQPRNQEALDELLDYLPISPLEMLKADMHIRRYEFMVPPISLELHRLWIERHLDLAREFYGDDALREAKENTPRKAATAAAVGTNRNLASGTGTSPEDYQGEVQVVVNPADSSQIVAAANTMAGCGGVNTQAAFASTDGGVTWSMTCPPDHEDFGFGVCEFIGMPGIVIGSDPALSWGADGVVSLEYMLVCVDGLLGGLLGMDFGIVVSHSSDAGATWTTGGTVINTWGAGTIQDKEFFDIDRNAGSPYVGRHYTCWDTANNEQFAWSADSGSSWNQVDLPAAPTGGTDLGCEIAVEKSGAVDVIFDTLTCSGNDCTNEEMYFTRSTDGGASWGTPVRIRDFQLASFSGANKPGPQDERGINPFGAIDVDNSGGACDGTLYATFTDFVTGTVENTDIFVSRSTDHGATWSAPVRVNDDGEGGASQFHPFLVVDQSDGSVVVVWHDARNDAANHQIDIYLARSTDCGLTFEPNIQVTVPSAEFNDSAISWTNVNTADNSGRNPNQFGEYMGLDVLNGTAYVAWMDSRHYFPSNTTEAEKENIGFATVTFTQAAPPLFADGFESGDTSAWSGGS
jgi:hypothetical protein